MLDYDCEICNKHISSRNKINYFKSKPHIGIGTCDHVIISLNKVDIDEIERFIIYI